MHYSEESFEAIVIMGKNHVLEDQIKPRTSE
jgi:hypothetical protein